MNRSLSADVIKTLSIFGAVYLHVGTLIKGTFVSTTVFSWLLHFCVPCFVVLWGYFFEKSFAQKNNAERKTYIKKRFIHTFRVFIVWSLIHLLLVPDFWRTAPIAIIKIHFSGHGWFGQYFFIVLLQLILLFPVIRWLYAKKIFRYVIVVATVILYFTWSYALTTVPKIIYHAGVRPFIYWVGYVFLGIALARSKVQRVPLFLWAIVFLIPAEFYALHQLHLTYLSYLTLSVLIGSALFCTALLQHNFTIKSATMTRAITYIGANTMTIFVVNHLVIKGISGMIPRHYFKCDGEAGAFIFSAAITIMVGALCLLGAEIIKKIRLNGIIN